MITCKSPKKYIHVYLGRNKITGKHTEITDKNLLDNMMAQIRVAD